MKPERDRSTLPKWAQKEIARLEQDLAHTRAKLSVGPDDSDTFADPYSDSPQPLGRGTTIEFRLDTDSRQHWRRRVHVQVEDGTLRINGTDQLQVLPRASNVIEVSGSTH